MLAQQRSGLSETEIASSSSNLAKRRHERMLNLQRFQLEHSIEGLKAPSVTTPADRMDGLAGRPQAARQWNEIPIVRDNDEAIHNAFVEDVHRVDRKGDVRAVLGS